MSFGPASRYAAIPTATFTLPDGRVIAYVTRRFLPDPARLAVLETPMVTDGDRPDTLAATHLGDPELWWRLCDANDVLHPRELTLVSGRRVRVTLPDGIAPPPAE